MTEDELLERALNYSATIHQPHAIKSYQAAKNIFTVLGNNAIWEQADKLIFQSEVYNVRSFTQDSHDTKFSLPRIQSILNRSIYPVAYSALYQWYRNYGFKNIFDHYIKSAASNNEYLSHNVTILLSFQTLLPKLNEKQIYPFLDRFTEFLTSTFGNTSKQILSESFDQNITFQSLLNECIHQPSFFGHNLITLTWLMRCENQIPSELMQKFKFHLHIQATTPLEDPEDELDADIYSQSLEGDLTQFMLTLDNLIFGTCKNLHQVTLADALLYLQQQFPIYTRKLNRIADYQIRLLKRSY
ncbi:MULTISPECIES: hypothetical protein [Acinetobacter]|uniref:hypothetical protein n=1 Tax=Acinetobacter TaxID=469 RepID=UPI0002CED8E9|nr:MULTISPECIES: hypothetical protein [Acinetobacter]ENX56331.1 hypothetical protein F885_03706 [Acinetobacter higginsii]